MSHKPVVYRLESQSAEDAAWEPVLDEHRQQIIFTGRGSKAQALTMGALMLRYPSFWNVRVRCEDTIVKVWTRKEGQTS